MASRPAALIAVLALAGAGAPAALEAQARPATPAIRIVFGGDVMLGRGVARLAASDPNGVFSGVRFQLASADLAVANLESPLTLRPHLRSRGPDALEARPATARLLKAAGFDAMAIANNHAGDAGPMTVPDTMRALAAAGLPVLGAGATLAAAFEPTIVTRNGVRVAFLSFDTTGQGPRAGPASPGVAWWNERRARAAVARARSEADLVVVGLHGGADYIPLNDPYISRLGRVLASWGVDVVWGTGPHVAQPVHVIYPNGMGRATVVATSLGNLIFDQHIPGTQQGALLEVLATTGGLRAYRVGQTDDTAGPVTFKAWAAPRGNAVAIAGDWWSIAGRTKAARLRRSTALGGFPGTVVAAAIGDPEGNGRPALAVSFWRPFRETDVNELVPRSLLVSRRGLTAHIGLYRPGDLRPLWVAGTLLRPIVSLAPCDGAVAVAYTSLNGAAVVSTGALVWSGFGFQPTAELPGPGLPGCAELDGRLDPIVLGRRAA